MKQRAQRYDFPVVSAISDGTLLFDGRVANISETGMKVVDIPDKLKLTAAEYRTVISAKGRNYRLAISPVWVAKKGINLEAGFKIVSPSRAWEHFFKSFVSQ